MNGLEISNLTINAGVFVVDNVTITIPAGEYFVLMGHTGAGKSLLMKSVCGLQKISEGKITIHGNDVTDWEPRARKIGYVPQDSGLFPHLDVYGNISFALDLIGLKSAEIDERVKKIATETGITHLLKRDIRGLSGGERQKTALARALTRQPDLLLLDEPVSALDEKNRVDICMLLKQIQCKHQITTVHICHNKQEAEQLGDRIGVMNAGRLVTVENLKKSE